MTSLPNEQKQANAAKSMLINADRLADVEQKHKAVTEMLRKDGYHALLLQLPENFAWFTSGANSSRGNSHQTTASLFITAEGRVVVCNNIDSPQLFDRELPSLGFQLKERPWQEPRHLLVDDLCRGRKVASDTGYGRTTNVADTLRSLRLPLTVLECERIRELGKRVTHAVEASARHCWRGETESQIAGQVAHRLMKHQIHPERIQVWADGVGDRYRHWGYGDNKLDRYCMISAVGRKFGLCVAVARTVCFGEPPKELRDAYHKAVLMQATGMFFSQPQWKLYEVWNRVHRIYEKFGVSNEWRMCDQGEVMGYEPCEIPVLPNSEYHLTPRMAVCWHPSVGPAYLCDTVLVGQENSETLTTMAEWPKLKVEVKGTPLFRPEILRREWYDNLLEGLLHSGQDEHGDSILMKQVKPTPGDSGAGSNIVANDSIFGRDGIEEGGGDSIFD